jgi:NAD dependent epimerase/dehydratase
MDNKDWNGVKVLVTGAGGFIGSHLTERLADMGADVRAMVRYSSSGLWGWLEESPCRDRIKVFAGDLQDRDSVKQAMRECEVVFHLGALIAIPYSYTAPVSYVRVNVEGTLNVLQAAREVGVRRLVHTSTSEVYGTAMYAPIDEKHPLQGQSPYSASKIGADKLVESFHRSFGVAAVTVRPFNTFGPRQSARAVIPTIITQILAGRERIELGNLTPTRDMNYVANTVDAFLAAARSEKAIGQTIHFGSGREIAIGDLAQLIAKLMNRPVEVVQTGERHRPDKSEVERLIADNRLALATLDWRPAVSLEEGLLQTIGWLEKNLSRYKPNQYNV